jgi:hypothetical protein
VRLQPLRANNGAVESADAVAQAVVAVEMALVAAEAVAVGGAVAAVAPVVALAGKARKSGNRRPSLAASC